MDAAMSNPYCIVAEDSFTTGPFFNPNGFISNNKKTVFPEVIPVEEIKWVGDTTKQDKSGNIKSLKFYQREGTFTALTGEGTLGSFKIIVQYLGVIAKPVDPAKLQKQAEDTRKLKEQQEEGRRMVKTQENNDRIEHDTQLAKNRKHLQELAADPEQKVPEKVAEAKVKLTFEQEEEELQRQLTVKHQNAHLARLKSEVASTSNNGSVAKDPDWYSKHVQRGEEQLRNQGVRERADDRRAEEHVPGLTEQHFLEQAARERWEEREYGRHAHEADARVAFQRSDGNSNASRIRDIPPHELFERRLQSETKKRIAAEQELDHMRSEEDLRRERIQSVKDKWSTLQTTDPPRRNQSQISYIPEPPAGTRTRPIIRDRFPERPQGGPAWR